MDARTNNRLFLLGLASLGLGCSVGVDEDTSFGPPPTPASNGNSTPGDSGGTTGDDSAETGAPPGSTGSPPVTITDPGDASADADGSTSVPPPPPPPPPPSTSSGGGYGYEACVAYGTTIGQCYNDPAFGDYLVGYCLDLVAHFEMLGELQCAAAYEDFAACIGVQPCVEIMGPAPCPAEGMALAALSCPFPN